MAAIWPIGNTALERQDDELDAQARAVPQLGTRNISDRGSRPTERDRLLQNFANHCRIWYEWNKGHCVTARRIVYSALVHRHGSAVLRWQPEITAILDRAEAEARNEQKAN